MMPPGLTGAALVFWGWQTNHFWIGVATALTLEAARWLRSQWELSETDYHRVWDLCALMFIGASIYFSRSREVVLAGYVFVQWWPVIFAPIMAAQWVGSRPDISYRTFSWLKRRQQLSASPEDGLNIAFPYFALVLFAASATNRQSASFYPGFCGLAVWGLGSVRSRHFHLWLWSALIVVCGLAGFEGQQRLHALQGQVEVKLGQLIAGLVGRHTDVREHRTAIGRIGQIHLSGRILYRVSTDGSSPRPPRIREASYSTFRRNAWYGAGEEFFSLTPETNDVWNLIPDKVTDRSITVAGFLRRGAGLLALPHGTARIDNLPALEMEYNPLGAVRVAQAPGLVEYRAYYGPGRSLDSAPTQDDESVPKMEEPALNQVLQELGLSGSSATNVLPALSEFFHRQFQYRTYQTKQSMNLAWNQTPIGQFLTVERAGHCEYFATATVLLLRQLGLPARYAVGYAVQESIGPGRYVIRERHAHAWCLVYRQGEWEDFDTTPAIWATVESEKAGWSEPLFDLWSWLWYHLARLRQGQADFRHYLLGLLIPVALGLLVRIVIRRRRLRERPSARPVRSPANIPGLDSDFYAIETRLARSGWNRHPGEPLKPWLARIEPAIVPPCSSLAPLLDWHYRWRFDPHGLSPTERAALRQAVRDWLRQFERQPGPKPASK